MPAAMRWPTAAIVILLGVALPQASADSAAFLQPATPTGLSAGTNLLYVRATLADNPAYTIFDPAGSRTVEFDYEFERAHLFWAAYTDPSGLGVRFQSMIYDADSDRPKRRLTNDHGAIASVLLPDIGFPSYFQAPSNVLAAGIGTDRLWFRSHLRIISTDFEITQRWDLGTGWIVASAGGRYQVFEHQYGADLDNLGDGITSELQKLRSERRFKGVGPTAQVEVRQALFGPWAVYGGARGSLVVGTANEEVGFVRSLMDPAGTIGQGTHSAWSVLESRTSRILPLVELELGVEYGATLGWLHVFVRGGPVWKSYFNAGGAAGGSGTVHLMGGQIAIGVGF
jgi:hypothetical protein